mgnify:CR=1
MREEVIVKSEEVWRVFGKPENLPKLLSFIYSLLSIKNVFAVAKMVNDK